MATFEKKIDRARDGVSQHPRAVVEDGDGMGANSKGLLRWFYQGNIQKSYCSVENERRIQKILKSGIWLSCRMWVNKLAGCCGCL